MEEEPLFRTSTGKEDMNNRAFQVCGAAGATASLSRSDPRTAPTHWLILCAGQFGRPAPVTNFGQIVAMLGYIQLVALDLLGVPLAHVLHLVRQPRHSRYRIQRELEAVDIVEHAHVEWR